MDKKESVTITVDNLKDYLEELFFSTKSEKSNMIGVVNGLAYTHMVAISFKLKLPL